MLFFSICDKRILLLDIIKLTVPSVWLVLDDQSSIPFMVNKVEVWNPNYQYSLWLVMFLVVTTLVFWLVIFLLIGLVFYTFVAQTVSYYLIL